MSFRRTWAVARKEGLHIVRDPRSLAAALAIPLVFLLLFGYALSLDVDRIATLVYDADRTPQSRELAMRLQGSRYFEIVGATDSYAGIEKAIDASLCLMGLVIPTDYSRNVLAGRKAEVQVILDGSDSNTASIALSYADALLRGYGASLRAQTMDRKGAGKLKPAVEGQLRVWYNSELKSRNYVVPGLIAVIIMIISALITSLTIAREWEMGTMEQLLSTPLRPAELVLGKMSAFFVLGFTDMVISIVVGLALFKVPLRGSMLLLIGTSWLFLFGALCWGIFLSAVTRSQLLAYQMGMLSSFLPAFLLSGFIYAIENMPLPIKVVTYIFPARYFITITKGIFLKGVGLEVLWVEVAFLAVFSAVVFVVATRKLRQKLA